MKTQKYMGRHMLLKRLTAQVGGDEQMARELLIKRGHMRSDGSLTPEGRKRDAMTAEERAKDRAAQRNGGSPTQFQYNPRTNTATRKR